MERRRYDSLERMFRTRLNNVEPSDDWAKPPRLAFEQALKEVGRKKRKRRLFILIPLFGLLAIIGFTVVYNLLDNRIEKIEDVLENKETIHPIAINNEVVKDGELPFRQGDDSQSIQSTPAIAERELTNAERVDSSVHDAKSLSAPSKNFGGQSLNENTQSQLIFSPVSDLREESTGSGVLNNPSTNAIVLGGKHKESFDATEEVNVLDQLVSEKLNLFPTEIAALPIVNIDPFDLIPREFFPHQMRISGLYSIPTKKSKLALFVLAGNNLSRFSMNNVNSSQFSLTKYDNRYLGYAFDVGLSYSLSNRIDLQFISGFQKIVNQSLFEHNFAYDESNEYVDAQGELHYDMIMNVESPLESIAERRIFSLGDFDLSNGDLIMNNTDITESLHVLSLATELSYNVFSKGAFNLAFNSGIGFSQIIKSKEQLSVEMLHKDDKMTSMNIVHDDLRKLNSNYFSARLGLEVDLELGKRFSILGRTSYLRSLSSLREITGLNSTETFLVQWSTGIGIKYQL